jgi:hypothetical protein
MVPGEIPTLQSIMVAIPRLSSQPSHQRLAFSALEGTNTRTHRWQILKPSMPTIPPTALAETSTLGKLQLLITLSSRGNGGFYPEQAIAAYRQTYVEKLRHYERPKTPIEYCRPKSTLGARQCSQVKSPIKQDVYLMSQSFHIPSKSAKKENQFFRKYQIRNDDRLAAPKRVEPKYLKDRHYSLK